MAEFHRSSEPRLKATFKDANGTDVDPTTVTVKYEKPDGTEVTKVYLTDAEVIKDSTGHYHIDVDADQSGVWHFRWESSTPQTAAEEIFTVKDTVF